MAKTEAQNSDNKENDEPKLEQIETHKSNLDVVAQGNCIDDEPLYQQAMQLYDSGQYDMAASMLKELAEKKHIKSMSALAVLYFEGHGVEKDITLANNLSMQSALKGDARGQNNIGVSYRDGEGVTQNYTEAVRWFRKSAKQGFSRAQNNLGLCYLAGKGVEKDCEEAKALFEVAARDNNSSAQYNLGRCYYYGYGTDVDYEKAIKWFRAAAEKDLAGAEIMLSTCYTLGRGVDKDDKDGNQINGLAAYYGCWGEPVNKEKAAKEFANGATKFGDASSQYNLGVCFDRGDGVAQNRNEAAQWFSKAAKKGLPEAKCCLGVYCLCNYGLTSGSHAEAVQWFREAAAQGLPDAEFYLGMCFLNGNGVPANYDEAKTWLNKASNSGSTLAKNYFFFHPEFS